MHAAFLRKALTWKPLNCIFVLVKCERRFDAFIKELTFQAQIAKGFEQKVVFLVSHLDQSDNPDLLIRETNKILNEIQCSNQVIYFSNLKCRQRVMSDTLYQVAISMPQSSI